MNGGKFCDKIMIRSGFERYFQVFLLLITPFQPFSSVLAGVYMLFLVKDRDFLKSVFIAAYIGLGLAGFTRPALIAPIIVLFLDTLCSRRVLLFLGSVLSGVVTYYVLGYASDIRSYISCFSSYVSGNRYEVIGIHIVLFLVVLVITIYQHKWFDGSRIAGYFRENQQAFPALLFMAFLVAAAAYLALGNEVLANKLAELGYYSLVIAVALAIAGLRGSGGEAEAGDEAEDSKHR
ncbi:MAG: hypothetical protein GXO43_09410 [Crenarchaeota archaeon]|nr:hypothetical protein [Thermoproteota archaeon]